MPHSTVENLYISHGSCFCSMLLRKEPFYPPKKKKDNVFLITRIFWSLNLPKPKWWHRFLAVPCVLTPRPKKKSLFVSKGIHLQIPPLPTPQLTGILLPSKLLPFFQMSIYQRDSKLQWEDWWAGSLWSHPSSLLRKPHQNWMLILHAFYFYTGLVHLRPHPVKRPRALKSHWFQHKFWPLCNQSGQKSTPPNKTPDAESWKQSFLADVGLGKRWEFSSYSFSSTLKEDFFWQGCEITAYILRIVSYQWHNVTVNWFSAGALSLQTLSLSSVLQKWF